MPKHSSDPILDATPLNGDSQPVNQQLAADVADSTSSSEENEDETTEPDLTTGRNNELMPDGLSAEVRKLSHGGLASAGYDDLFLERDN